MEKETYGKLSRCHNGKFSPGIDMRTCWYLHVMFLAKLINKNDYSLYRDDRLLMLRNLNGQQIDRIRKNMKIFKDTGFPFNKETNLKIIVFLDITSNLNNDTYRPYKKPDDLSSHINKSSNHPAQIINQLPKIVNKR